MKQMTLINLIFIFIGPESDHWLCLSLTQWLTDWLLFSKLDCCDGVSCEDANSNLLRFLLLLMLMMRNVVTIVLCRFGSWSLVINLNFVQTLRTRFGQEFEVEVQAKFWNWSLVSILLLRLGEVMKWMFGQDFEVKVWSKCWCLVEILNIGIWSRYVKELVSLVSRTQPSGPLCLWQCLIISLSIIYVHVQVHLYSSSLPSNDLEGMSRGTMYNVTRSPHGNFFSVLRTFKR